ncbi:MAG: TonB-dependent receptor [Sphingopyxis sp.]|nr:TonB-dependent receptor [Sphingopyxis sp.]
MFAHSRGAAFVALVGCFGIAEVADARSFDVRPGSVGEVVGSLGAQAGVTITVTDPGVARRRSPGVRGDLSLREAIDRALRGTGAEAHFYDRTTIRIVAQRTRAKPPERPKPPSSAAPKPPIPVDIVVTASKQNMLLDHYPGSARIIESDLGQQARAPGDGTAMLIDAIPALSSTNLGRGRNKIYVRGIADSSFTGPTQATVGQYLGEARLNYSAPDPDLSLYDMERVEVLAGPQGTLYGAGALGGIVRLVPNPPDPTAASATASTGLSATRFGAIGGDAAIMVNLPLRKDDMAIRLVAYGKRDPGYIDDPSRDLRDINRTKVFGQRLTWRIEDVGGWTVDVGGVFQRISIRDGQYVLRGDPPLVRNNVLAQPFRNEYRMAFLTARRPIGATELVSASAVVWHDLTSVFDATGSDGTSAPRRFEERTDITFYSHETRLSGGGVRSPWVVGLAGVYNISGLTRSVGAPTAPERIAGIRNRQVEGSVFGQVSLPIFKAIELTFGMRLSASRSAGRLLDDPDAISASSRTRISFVPTVAVNWQVSDRVSLYANYQEGVRAGGFAFAPHGDGTPVGQEFQSDELGQAELGIRWKRKDSEGLSLRAALFGVDWSNIQADLIGADGLPYTANIGNGRIMGLDGEIRWRVSPELALSATGFFNGSFLYGMPPPFDIPERSSLPNIAENGARLAAEWRFDLARGVSLTGDSSLRYVGRSDLGVGPLLNISQGDYMVVDVGTRVGFGHWGLSLDVSNIGDMRGNSFAFGNPFGVQLRNQMTPLRPRTVRVGLDVRF